MRECRRRALPNPPTAQRPKQLCLPVVSTSLLQYHTSSFSVRWEQLGYAPDTQATVRDLWAGEDRGVFNGSFSADVRR